MRSLIVNLLKWGVSLAIVGYLFVDATRNDNFQQLASGPKNWPQLAIALLFVLTGVLLTIVRWFILVRALDLPFSFRDALRLGFLGYLLNFISLGAVGGDLFKAIFVAREHPSRRADAVATVILDRVIGLYALFVVATTAILLTRVQTIAGESVIAAMLQGTFAVTAIGAIAIVVLMLPAATRGRLPQLVARLPGVGRIAAWTFETLDTYRKKPVHLAVAMLLSLAVHSSTSTGIFFTAKGLLHEYPSLATHLVVVPMAMVSGVLPLPLNGLGGFEYLLDFLYQHVAGEVAMSTGHSLLVAFGYRIETILVALIGAAIYLTSRREIDAVLHDPPEQQVELQSRLSA